MKNKLLLAALLAFAAAAEHAEATVTGDVTIWQSHVSNVQSNSSFGTPFNGTNSFSVGGIGVFNSAYLGISQIGYNFSTGPWVQGYAGQVLQGGNASSITMIFSDYITAFSILMTPNYYQSNLMTLTVGGETLTQRATTTPGLGSGAFFGWFGDPIKSLTISTDGGSNTIAFGKVSIGSAVKATPVPGPEAGAGLGALAMLGVAYWAKRHRDEKAIAA